MARQDESILLTIDGYRFKKGRERGTIFMMAPDGCCFSIQYSVLLQLMPSLASDTALRAKFGL